MHRAALAVLLVALAGPALAGREHLDLSEAVRRGEILSLPEIKARIGTDIADRIVEIEVERKAGQIIYEIYYIDSEGRRREVEIDAKTGDALRNEPDD